MKKRVCIAAGHGGKDPGAVNGNMREKDYTLPISLEIGRILESKGVSAIQTRVDDTFVSLNNQAMIANKFEVDVFVSVHLNAADNSLARGVETYSMPGKGEAAKLANSIQKSVDSSGIFTTSRGVKTANFAVLRLTNMPAALVELGFITNKYDVQIIRDNINPIALSVAIGILKYLHINPQIGGKKEEEMTGEVIYKRLIAYLNGLPTSEYAKESSKKGIESGLFVDGDGDGLVDNPKSILTREQLAVVLNRAGLLD